MGTLTSYQAAALMLCFSLSRLTAFRPEGDNLLICAAAELVSAFVLAAVCFFIPARLTVRSRPVSRICGAVSGAYLLVMLALQLSSLAGSLQYSYPDFYASPAIIISASAAAAYCASMGLRGCGRAACAAVVMALITLVLVAVGSAGRFEPDRLDIAVTDRGGQFIRQLTNALGSACEIPLAVILCGRTVSPRRAGLIWFCGHSLVWAGMLTLCAGVIGEHALFGIPTDTLSSYSKTSVIERFDALMLLIWTLCSVLAAAGLLLGLRKCAAQFGVKAEEYAPAAGAVICGSAACVMTGHGGLISGALSAGLLAAAVISGAGVKGGAAG